MAASASARPGNASSATSMFCLVARSIMRASRGTGKQVQPQGGHSGDSGKVDVKRHDFQIVMDACRCNENVQSRQGEAGINTFLAQLCGVALQAGVRSHHRYPYEIVLQSPPVTLGSAGHQLEQDGFNNANVSLVDDRKDLVLDGSRSGRTKVIHPE